MLRSIRESFMKPEFLPTPRLEKLVMCVTMTLGHQMTLVFAMICALEATVSAWLSWYSGYEIEPFVSRPISYSISCCLLYRFGAICNEYLFRLEKIGEQCKSPDLGLDKMFALCVVMIVVACASTVFLL